MRGDPPYHDHLHGDGNKSTPHARGSTVYRLKQITGIAVYPACAGIHPTGLPVSFACRSLPRMRGDPPAHPSGGIGYLSSTPHARGSTLHKNMMQKKATVYPACAGIHPPAVQRQVLYRSLPRMRGDPPFAYSCRKPHAMSTPHARGSTCRWSTPCDLSRVYPACAGIHLAKRQGLGG